MPVVTQSRSLWVPSSSTVTYRGATTSYPRQILIGYQTTTGFRTGPSSGTDYDNLDGASLRRDALIEGQRSTKWDNGNEFSTESWSYGGVNRFHARRGADVFTGDLQLSVPGAVYPSLSTYTSAERNKFGAQAIADTVPSKPHAELAVFFGELREGLPSLPFLSLLRSRGPKGLGSEHLNMEFGIKPMIGDIQKACRAVVRAGALLRQWERDSGRQVRRRRTIVDETSVSTLSNTTLYIGADLPPGLALSYFADRYSSTPCTRRLTTTNRVWFSGAYSYLAVTPAGFSGKIADYEQRANLLLGTRFTVSDFWELTRWSWLIDWFADVGDVLTNAESLSSDSMVLRYGYLCVHQRAEWDLVSTRVVTPLTEGPRLVPHIRTWRERKARYRATPYGFGVSVPGFSARRWAILGALGMTKAPDSLRLRS